MSTAYYALFHCLARNCADTLVGRSRAHRSGPAWRTTYRALEHGYARTQCSGPAIKTFPTEIRELAESFADMQQKRQLADYDPETRWRKSDVEEDIDEAADTIDRFEAASAWERRAFAVFVLLRNRSR